MYKSNITKSLQLGMPFGTASNKLRKTIIFNLLLELNKNYCFQCGEKINSQEELSIEHKIPYLHSSNPKDLFFGYENIAFSHLHCNIKAGRRRLSSCGTTNKYNKGCRCKTCTEANTIKIRKIRAKKKAVSVAQMVEAIDLESIK